MATTDQVRKTIDKAKILGLKSLTAQELEWLKSAAKQAGGLGNEIRNLFK